METENLRVLIAEDEPLVTTVIEAELEAMGATVVGKAPDGLQAVEMTAALVPDVVLLDIEMPGLNGIEAARAIQARCPTPVVMLTVYSEQDMIKKAAAAGVGAYLLKPPNARELERAFMVARARFTDLMELRRLNADLTEAVAHIKRLQGILPICMYCHRIRTDRASWEQIENYIEEHSEAQFTHGICPECYQHHFPGFQPAVAGSGPPAETHLHSSR